MTIKKIIAIVTFGLLGTLAYVLSQTLMANHRLENETATLRKQVQSSGNIALEMVGKERSAAVAKEQELAEAIQKYKTAAAENLRLEAVLASGREERAKLLDYKKNHRQMLGKTQWQLVQKNLALEKAQAELTQARDDAEAAEKKTAVLQDKVESLEEAMKDERLSSATALESNKRSAAELDSLRSRLALIEPQAIAAKALDARNRQLKTELETAKKELDRFASESPGMRSELNAAKTEKAGLAKSLAEQKKAAESAQAGYAEALKRLKTQAIASKAMDARNRLLQSEVDTLKKALEKEMTQTLALRKKLEQAKRSPGKKVLAEDEPAAGKPSVAEVSQAGKAAEALRRETAIAHYNLGVLHMQDNRYGEAATEFEYALQGNAADAYAHYNLGLLYDLHLHDPQRAIQHYENYIKLLPTAGDIKKVQYRLFQVKLQQDAGLGKDLSKQK